MQDRNENFIQYLARLVSSSLRFRVSSEHFHSVYEGIAEGSQPEVRFYIMVVVSTLIAGFGLISNSTAVVIGAMLVAPLMTPIFGISLSLVREDAHLLRQATRAEILGVLAAVGMGFAVGWALIAFDPYLKITPEMLSRTKPNLSDLAVAVLAGLAGAYALIDEKISPALPGVAIATAIVPPLANCGLCLAFGAYSGALGSFLLFFTNFISILLVSAILFHKAGMARASGSEPAPRLFRKFGLAAVGFIVMAAILAHSVFTITREQTVHHAVKEKLTVELSDMATTGIEKLITNIRDGKVHAMAEILSPVRIDSSTIKRIEDQLAEQLDMPIYLVVREIGANDISSEGSDVAVVNHTLDGFLIDKKMRPEVLSLQTAEKIINAFLKNHADLHLVDADYFSLDDKPVILAKISGFHKLALDEIRELQSRIRAEVKQPRLTLVMRFENVALYTEDGLVLPCWRTRITPEPAQIAAMDSLVAVLDDTFAKNDNYLLESVHKVIERDGYEILAAISGSGTFARNELTALQQNMTALARKPVKLYAWINQGPVMTENGLVSFAKLNEIRKAKISKADQNLLHKVLRRVH